jgi:hypothetical protein
MVKLAKTVSQYYTIVWSSYLTIKHATTDGKQSSVNLFELQKLQISIVKCKSPRKRTSVHILLQHSLKTCRRQISIAKTSTKLNCQRWPVTWPSHSSDLTLMYSTGASLNNVYNPVLPTILLKLAGQLWVAVATVTLNQVSSIWINKDMIPA